MKDFMIGAATAAHQVEGNNTNSDCWAMENIPHSSYDEPSKDAVDHYHHYREDIDLLAEAGLDAYRFSIEWARIQPDKDSWDEKEIQHYRDVIEYCRKKKVEPIVTLHHFSSPKWLISLGGWENPEVVSYFERYVRRIVTEYKDILTYICTINEANMRLQLQALIKDMMARMSRNTANVQVGFNAGAENQKLMMMETAAAFGLQDPRKVANFVSPCTPEGDLLVMKAHRAAVKAIREICPHAKVGLTLSLHDIHWKEGGEEEAKANWNDEFLHYLPYLEGDDFLGVQCYTEKWFDEHGVMAPDPDRNVTQMGYVDAPRSIGNVVKTVARSFQGDLIVTENGIATSDDERRCEFIREAVDSVKECAKEGIPVKGYMYWSLLDNFEWQKGFSKTFGLIAVDRETMERKPKKSLKVLGELNRD
jgi:beta-glucosidase